MQKSVQNVQMLDTLLRLNNYHHLQISNEFDRCNDLLDYECFEVDPHLLSVYLQEMFTSHLFN